MEPSSPRIWRGASELAEAVRAPSYDGYLNVCTELPLIHLEQAFGIPLLDTTTIHLEGIVATCFEP